MIYRNTNRSLNEDINEDLQSEIKEMFKENQRMDMIPPNFNFKCELKCMVWDDMNRHKNNKHKLFERVKLVQVESGAPKMTTAPWTQLLKPRGLEQWVT